MFFKQIDTPNADKVRKPSANIISNITKVLSDVTSLGGLIIPQSSDATGYSPDQEAKINYQRKMSILQSAQKVSESLAQMLADMQTTSNPES